MRTRRLALLFILSATARAAWADGPTVERTSDGAIDLWRFADATWAVMAEGDLRLGDGAPTAAAEALAHGLGSDEVDNLVGRSAEDAWAVTTRQPPFTSTIHHRVRGLWTRVTSLRDTVVVAAAPWKNGTLVSFVEPLAGVRGPGPRLVAFGGGRAPALTPARKRPRSQTGEPPSCTTRVAVRDLLGFASGELFFVGEACDEGDDGLLVEEHLDARGRRGAAPLPGASVAGSPGRVRLRGLVPTAVCVGANLRHDDGAYVARFDGERWTSVELPPGADAQKLVELDCGPSDVWVILGSGQRTTLYRRSAAGAWDEVPLPAWKAARPMTAVDVAARRDGGAWIVGQESAGDPRAPSALLSWKP
jgi:hypothetical protein